MPTVPVFLNKDEIDRFDRKCKLKGLNRYQAAKEALRKYLENEEHEQPSSGIEGRGQETVKVSY